MSHATDLHPQISALSDDQAVSCSPWSSNAKATPWTPSPGRRPTTTCGRPWPSPTSRP